MKYVIMSFETPECFAVRSDPDPKKGPAFWSDMGHYIKAIKESGVFAGGAGLLPPDTATTVRYRNEQRLVQDGPYADIKEQLGGFFVVDVPDLDTALEWAARFPRQPGRVIEVRPALPEPGE